MKSRILVVSPDAEMRATLGRWLIAAGYAVEPAEGEKHAREVAATQPIALAIVAVGGPDEAGADAAREFHGPRLRPGHDQGPPMRRPASQRRI